MNGIRDLAALAADDAAAEEEIGKVGNALRLGLHAHAFHWDNRQDATPADWEEERLNRHALVWCLPVAIVSVAAIVWAWGV